MNSTHACPRPAMILADWLIGAPVLGETPPTAPPDAGLLEFLGELSGEEPLFLQYTTTREAERAAKDLEASAAGMVPVSGADRGAVAWDALDAPTQALLAGQPESWATLPPDRQQALADGAQRWLALDGIGRAQANERWHTWRTLTAGQRKQVRKAWARFRQLTPEQQQAMRAAFFRHQQLQVDDRSYVSDRWMEMTPDEQLRAIERRRAPGPQPGAFDKRTCPPC
ncbi:MAG: DUF3106 domain-containing protein [Gammaproteobacteria bacterium]|nr:DUF3106 domain-containing protein [Gammaproteobacteria bacterium]